MGSVTISKERAYELIEKGICNKSDFIGLEEKFFKKINSGYKCLRCSYYGKSFQGIMSHIRKHKNRSNKMIAKTKKLIEEVEKGEANKIEELKQQCKLKGIYEIAHDENFNEWGVVTINFGELVEIFIKFQKQELQNSLAREEKFVSELKDKMGNVTRGLCNKCLGIFYKEIERLAQEDLMDAQKRLEEAKKRLNQ